MGYYIWVNKAVWPHLKQCWPIDRYTLSLNTLRPGQNGRNFADDIFKCIFLRENARISLDISLKFVSKVRINNIPAFVQIMARRRPGDKPLSEPMMVRLPTHICVTRPQWVKSWIKIEAYSMISMHENAPEMSPAKCHIFCSGITVLI